MEPFQSITTPNTAEGKRREAKHKIFFSFSFIFPPSLSSHSSKLSIYFLITSVSLLFTLFQIQLLKHPLSLFPLPLAFLPLKDLNFASTPMDGNTWFMSSLNDTLEDGEAEHLLFPSASSHRNLLLCLSGRDRSNGTKNSYALAPHHSLPKGANLFKGLTFISDSYYDYENLWHGLSAMVPFMAWHSRKGCEKPERWLLYHWGELRVGMSPWVKMLVEAVMDEKVSIEDLEETGEGSFCFERAVVFRHNERGMGMERKKMVYDMMRCKARVFCRLESGGGVDDGMVRVTLLMRKGARSFKDERTVVNIFDRECGKVELGCRLKVIRPNNLTFCDQISWPLLMELSSQIFSSWTRTAESWSSSPRDGRSSPASASMFSGGSPMPPASSTRGLGMIPMAIHAHTMKTQSVSDSTRMAGLGMMKLTSPIGRPRLSGR